MYTVMISKLIRIAIFVTHFQNERRERKMAQLSNGENLPLVQES